MAIGWPCVTLRGLASSEGIPMDEPTIDRAALERSAGSRKPHGGTEGVKGPVRSTNAARLTDASCYLGQS